MRFRVISLAFLLAAGARASSVTDEIGVNTTQATDSNPRSGNVSDSLNAALDLTDHWSLNLGALITLEGQTPDNSLTAGVIKRPRLEGITTGVANQNIGTAPICRCDHASAARRT